MTGRGLGFCAGNDHPGFMADAPRMGGGRGRGGFGRGRGSGRGWGHGGGWGRGYGPGGGYGAHGWQAAPPATGPVAQDEVRQLREHIAQLNDRIDRLTDSND